MSHLVVGKTTTSSKIISEMTNSVPNYLVKPVSKSIAFVDIWNHHFSEKKKYHLPNWQICIKVRVDNTNFFKKQHLPSSKRNFLFHSASLGRFFQQCFTHTRKTPLVSPSLLPNPVRRLLVKSLFYPVFVLEKSDKRNWKIITAKTYL